MPQFKREKNQLVVKNALLLSILLIEIWILCEEIPWLLQPEWVRRSEQGHLWNSDSRGTLLSGGYFLHRQVGNTQNPNWANSLLFFHIPFCCCCFVFFLRYVWFVFSPVPDYVKATVETVLKIHETEDDGDVLAFLTGQVRSHIIYWPSFYLTSVWKR